MYQHHLQTLSCILVFSTALIDVRLEAHGGYDEELQRTNVQIAANPDNSELWFHRAWLNFLHGDWEQSLMDVEKADRLGPGKHPVDLMRGQALMAGGKLEAARAVLDDFVHSHPEDPDGFATRARVLLKLEKRSEAVADLRQSLAKTRLPEPDLYVETADALIGQQRPEEAVQVLQKGMAELGDIASLAVKALELQQSLGLYDAALSSVAVMQKSAPRPEPWMAKRAEILAKAGRLEEARSAWQALLDHLAALPNLERGSHAMSVIAEEARSALAQLDPKPASPEPTPHAPAVQVTQTDPAMLFPSRSILGQGSNYEEELDRMDRLILQQPANAEFRFQRGELNFLDGKWKWAREDCEEAERLAPGKFPVERLRAQILEGEGRIAEAKALLDKFIISHADDGKAHASRARLLLKSSQTEAALADYRSALACSPAPDCNLFLECAGVLQGDGRRDEAMQLLARALQIHKDEPALVTQSLELEVATGAFDAALIRVEAMQKTAPRPEPWMALRADLLTRAGRTPEARATWTELRGRILALPNLDRGSQVMSALVAQAEKALTELEQAPRVSTQSNNTPPHPQS